MNLIERNAAVRKPDPRLDICLAEPDPPAAAAPDVIVAEGLSVCYRGHDALRGVELTVPQKSITALIGPSGCGKTSFLNCLNRMIDLIPQCSASGTLKLDGMDLLAPDFDVVALRRRVGMIFQRPNPFPFSVRRNLELPLREAGVADRHARAEAIERCLRSVGLWDEVKDRLDQSALTLSGGQQQRLCIARALLLEPEVLLLDEPCSALDPISSTAVEEMIASLRGRCTMVIVTHNLAQARRISDRCALFWVCNGAGCVVEDGDTEQIFGTPRTKLAADYIGGAIA